MTKQQQITNSSTQSTRTSLQHDVPPGSTQSKTSWWNPFSWIGSWWSAKGKAQSEKNVKNVTSVIQTNNEQGASSSDALLKPTQSKTSWWNPFSWIGSWWSAKGKAQSEKNEKNAAEIKNGKNAAKIKNESEELFSQKEESSININSHLLQKDLETNVLYFIYNTTPLIDQSDNMAQLIQNHSEVWNHLPPPAWNQFFTAILGSLYHLYTQEINQNISKIFTLLWQKEKEIAAQTNQPTSDCLLIAVKMKSPRVVQFLLQQTHPISSDCLSISMNKNSCLWQSSTEWVSDKQFKEIRELILAQQISQDVLDETLRKVIDPCIPHETIQTLIAKGAKVNSPDPQGDTPLHIATKLGRCDIMTILLEHGADPDIKNQQGNTPLHIAISHPNSETQLLLKNGADPDIKNQQGKTPLDVLLSKAPTSFCQKDKRLVVKLLGDAAFRKAEKAKSPKAKKAALLEAKKAVLWEADNAKSLKAKKAAFKQVALLEAQQAELWKAELLEAKQAELWNADKVKSWVDNDPKTLPTEGSKLAGETHADADELTDLPFVSYEKS